MCFYCLLGMHAQVQDAIIASGRTKAPHLVAKVNRNSTLMVRATIRCSSSQLFLAGSARQQVLCHVPIQQRLPPVPISMFQAVLHSLATDACRACVFSTIISMCVAAAGEPVL